MIDSYLISFFIKLTIKKNTTVKVYGGNGDKIERNKVSSPKKYAT